MKIKIENIFLKFFEKFKKPKKEAKVIKFNSPFLDEEEKKTRKGARVEDEVKEKVKVNKNAKKIFIGMLMLLLLTTSLNIRYKDYLKLEEYEPKDVSSIAVSSNIDSTTEIVTAVKAEEKIVQKVEEKLIFIPALEGEVQKMYSTDKVIYSKTLQQWKTHDGIDISTSAGKEVVAIEKGVVESVYNDSFYGMTIEIEHINGYRSVYSNLDENVYVNIGESVIKGQKIGKVGNTSVGEYLDDPHLHFRLYFNDKNVNPTYIFN